MQAHLLTYTERGSTVKHKIKEMQDHLLTYTDMDQQSNIKSKRCKHTC